MTRGAMVVTGGIGSGKSVLVEALGATGFDTVDADRIGHRLLASGTVINQAVRRRWPEVGMPDGEVDRKRLAHIVFGDPDELAALEAITHPAIRSELRSLLESEGDLLVIDLSVPRAIADDEDLARLPVVVVDAPVELRRRRLTERGLEEPDVSRRLAAQPSRGEWLRLADLVVPNHGGLDSLRAAAEAVRRWFAARQT
ncbi:MAG TPA: dephospho-CoA kinase [Acidimicrobiia bacterium]